MDKFQFIALIALWAMAFFECRGYGLPRRFAPRNDSVLETFSTKIGAEINEKLVIANQCAHWCGNPLSRNAEHCID